VRQVFVIGRGASLATAGTGGLILKESVRLSAEGMSSAAFRHGPLEMTSPSVLTCICRGHGAAISLHESLDRDIRLAGGRVVWLDAPPELPEYLAPVLEILPVQMLSLALATLRGEEAGRFRHASKITTKE
jgi:glucosamine--fructose-6-phosphate aminotransferase (isomerizing)